MTGIPHVTSELVLPPGQVVVGDDGSRCSANAVTAAAEQARLRGTSLHVVRAWSIATAVRPEGMPRGVVPSLAELEEATTQFQRTRVAELVGDHPVEVTVHVVHAPAAQVLLQASVEAQLLVVGTRGLGGFKHLLLGSTAEQIVRHSSCDVLVTRLD